MDKLREDIASVSGSLEELESSQKMSLQEIDGLKQGVGSLTQAVGSLTQAVDLVTRSVGSLTLRVDGLRNSASQSHQVTTELRGTFASIEKHMVTLFETDEDLKAKMADLTLRVETLEKRAS